MRQIREAVVLAAMTCGVMVFANVSWEILRVDLLKAESVQGPLTVHSAVSFQRAPMVLSTES